MGVKVEVTFSVNVLKIIQHRTGLHQHIGKAPDKTVLELPQKHPMYIYCIFGKTSDPPLFYYCNHLF